MCVVSMVMDSAAKQPWWQPEKFTGQFRYSEVSREEFLELKALVEDLVDVVKAAQVVDEYAGQPDCEKPDLVEAFKTLARAVGVDVEDLL